MDPDISLKDFGLAKLGKFLDEAAGAILEAAAAPEEEAVHRMRVAIRRLQQSLRLFSVLVRGKGVRQVRTELKSIMEPAGELRNQDIALGLVKGNREVTAALRKRREDTEQVLATALASFRSGDLAARWRKQLGMEKA